ncbi:chromosome partitioning protein ParB [Photobacterium kishitanii]|uniref:ParB/RepB/Spo0J family partition protein n=1 Tax=Photobacterium kishitanii TaxID=318456 RepID=A0AAX0YTB3_9GAMM|nr:ParB/RepB/Spo0J family partition protein [Photobacterium kishitanii]KJG09446.1 chromosome partitioning protein ParB [Photobacterium kishitanii]KJG55236.1 chromosome partitioning protein ParB [Photobacterium kishitanii]KJG57484.1 chromosome partitioning protein ParB [Photobacterium kishitanii]KJG63570.1 chromosome partitioning protein ParB [Photobacterium kishitanii]OBU33696.1 chromosome partitioning protein ParB [Photobacterium kishitanii]
MAIKTTDLNARLFGKADKRRATNVTEAQTAARDKAAVIELAVAGEDTVAFELVKVKADDVSTQTIVFAENAREQAFLNEHALADILVTLKDRGQQYPAVGRWLDDGRIEVLDGSRRRMSCIIAHKDFLIYVAKGINTEHAKFLSDVANAHKPLSLFERGKEMQSLLDSGKVADQKELAKYLQCSEALVSGALKAASLPMELLMAYPSVGELGRPTIVKLHRIFFGLNHEQQQHMIADLSGDNASLWKTINAQGISRITREVTGKLEQLGEQLHPKAVVEKPTSQDLIKGKVSYTRDGDKLQLKLKKMSDRQINDVLAYLDDYLK